MLTKRALASDIAKTFDVLEWFSPATITVKILLQKVWEEKFDWDDPVPMHIEDSWSKWRIDTSSSPVATLTQTRKSYPPNSMVFLMPQSQPINSAVVYLRLTDASGCHQSLRYNVQDKSSTDQASLNSKARTLWCASTFTIAPPRQTSTLDLHTNV